MTRFLTLALGALLLAAAPAGAVSISFVASSIDANVGGEISFDVVVGDLGGEVVSAYDLDLSFDASKLAFTSFDFGELLGDGGANGIQIAGAAGGVFDVAEVSFLSATQLAVLQGDSVVIGNARFAVLAQGTSSVGVTQAIVGNGAGRPLPVTSAGSVRVNAAPVIPEPGALLLFALGLATASHALRRGQTPS